MQTQNNMLEHLVQLKLNNKISKLKALSLFELIKAGCKDNMYGLLLAELQTMLIPPENILKLTSELKEDTLPHEKAYNLMLKGNVECATWFKTVEPLEFDFRLLIKTIMTDEFNELYKVQVREIDESDLTHSQKMNAKNELFKKHLEMLKEVESNFSLTTEVDSKLKEEMEATKKLKEDYETLKKENEKLKEENEKANVRIITLIKEKHGQKTGIDFNKFGNLEHFETGLLIDPVKGRVYARQDNDGSLICLTKEDIKLCSLHDLNYDKDSIKIN